MCPIHGQRDEGDEMKLRLPQCLRSTNLLALFAAVLMIATSGEAEPLPLERAIRLALAHSTASEIATADVQRAFASYHELRNDYLPQLVVGSGLGCSYGFRLSIEVPAPPLVNVAVHRAGFIPEQR